jgi:hypothetical protein
VLREANLVRVEKRAQQRIYYVEPESMKELDRWIEQFRKMWETSFAQLGDVLEEMKKQISKE